MSDIVEQAKGALDATKCLDSQQDFFRVGMVRGLVAEVERLQGEIDRPTRRSANERQLARDATNPIDAFNLFIQNWVPETWHAHLLDNDDNDAEYVRDTVRYMRERLRARRISLAELESLPGESIVRDGNGTVWQNARHATDTWWQPGEGCGIGSRQMVFPVLLVDSTEAQ